MAAIRPFRGLRYDLPVAGDPADLLAPPYDVVDDAGRVALASRSHNNCVHVILPEADGSDGDKYAAGKAAFQRLMREALTRDDAPAYYVYHQRFESEGHAYVRKGFVSTIELTRFGAGPVKPHERTLSGPKEDRLRLMRACQAHLELVFGLFPDPDKRWETAVEGHLGEPVLRCSFDGTEHTLYRVDDPGACAALTAVLADKSVYIADGHHRYETMCTFRDELEEQAATDAGREMARFGMIYLSNLDDEGLVVLPTHRLVHGLAGESATLLADVVETLGAWFDVRRGPLPAEPLALRNELEAAGSRSGAAFALCVPGSGEMSTLTLKDSFDPEAAGLGELHEALQRLDVALLHELVLERGLGITKEAQAAKANLRYYKSTPGALEVARRGDDDTQLVCFMNATPVADVVAVCDSGQVMPQKSTFFHPKIPTGLCFHDLDVEGRRGD